MRDGVVFAITVIILVIIITVGLVTHAYVTRPTDPIAQRIVAIVNNFEGFGGYENKTKLIEMLIASTTNVNINARNKDE